MSSPKGFILYRIWYGNCLAYDVIIVEFLVSTIDHYIGYDVIDNNTGTLYFPYYSNDNNLNNLVLQQITEKIIRIFDELNNQNIITI